MGEENIEPLKKPLWKRYWFWLPIAILLVAGLLFVVWKTDKNNSQRNDGKESAFDNQNKTGDNAIAYDSSLPDCPANLSGLLNHELYDLSDLDVVIPLGNLSPGVHTIPTDHMYIDHLGKKRVSIFAPGDMTLISMDNKITYDAQTNQKIRDDYSIQFALCKGLTIYLNHFSELEPKIKEAFDNSKQFCETQHKVTFGVESSGMYYQPCQSQFKLSLKSGEVIGHIGTFAGGGQDPNAIGIDLGAYNYNGTPLPFAKPDRYSEDNLHAMCGLDLFTPELKNTYYSKLGDMVSDGTGVSVTPRVGEPLCGAYNQDIPGTLAGNWFAGNANTGSVTSMQYQMTLGNSVANSNIGEISLQGQPELGGNSFIKFEPVSTGNVNRLFSEVTPGDQMYCYQSTFSQANNAKLDKTGKPIVPAAAKYLIQLVDATHLKIEKQSGSCVSASSAGPSPETGWQFSNPFTYER